MNRRDFIAGVGALAATAAAARVIGGSRAILVSGSFAPNVQPLGTITIDQSYRGAAMALGYVPGSAEEILSRVSKQMFGEDNGSARTITGARVSVRGLVQQSNSSLERLEVLADFDHADLSSTTCFAWQFSAESGKLPLVSKPVSFNTAVDESVALVLPFSFRDVTSGAMSSGSLQYPIGGRGLGPGVYAVATPSLANGQMPDWSALMLGDNAGELARNDGGTIDFDYLTLVVSPRFA
jgi:hypothetical protein